MDPVDSIRTGTIKTQSPLMILPILVLPARTMLFCFIQVIFVYLFGFKWNGSIAWWPFFAIISNVIMFFLLSYLVKKEGKNYFDLIHPEKTLIKKLLLKVLWTLLIGGGLGFAGMSVVSYFMYGLFTPPNNMMLPLPFWAGIISFIFFPITNALVETPTYMGYCFPRLEVKLRSKSIALLLSAFFLAFQHFTLPILVNDTKYMLWHFLSMIPLSVIVGIIYIKIRSLIPIMIVHWLLDLLTILSVFIISIPH